MSADTTNWYTADVATFGDRVAAAREAAGMDQAAMAERLGVELQTLQNWEDDFAEPRANRLQMMSGILGVSMRWLISGEGDGPGEPEFGTDASGVDLQEIMTELRELRASFIAKAEQVGRIEKRLRKVLHDR